MAQWHATLEGVKYMMDRADIPTRLARTEENYKWQEQLLGWQLTDSRNVVVATAYTSAQIQDTAKCHGLAVPAVNRTEAIKIVCEAAVHAAMRARIELVLNMAAINNVETLILGTFGCGGFGHDATRVALMFKEFLDTTYRGVFKHVVFAISTNDASFTNVFYAN